MIVDVRPGGIDDLADVTSVMMRAFDPRFGEAWTSAQCVALLGLPGATLHVARAPGLIGFALSRSVLDECELMLLAVEPTRRRAGVGRALLDRVGEDAAAAGAKSLFLEVRANNAALHFYRKAGFRQVGERRDYYRGADGQSFNAETYRRDLV